MTKIGKGKTLEQSEREIIMIAEGVRTAKSAYDLARTYKLNTPIIDQVYEILYLAKQPKKAVHDLMLREPKSETELEIGKITI